MLFEKNTIDNPMISWRFFCSLMLLFLAVFILLLKTASLQVISLPFEITSHKHLIEKLIQQFRVTPEFLQHEGGLRAIKSRAIPATRGRILDRNGEPLAVSTPVFAFSVNPQLFNIKNSELTALIDVLDENPVHFIKKLNDYKDRGRGFMYLKRQLTPIEADKVRQLKLSGISEHREYARFYPAGEVAGHLLGFTNIDDQGLEGLELAYDQHLIGKPGKKKVLQDLQGNVVRDLNLIVDPRAGKDIHLSIDLRLQYLAHRELKAAVERFGAKKGSVIVLDAKTGELLAMTNQPSFNPNDLSQRKPNLVRNRALTDVFEPGSTVKPLTILAALESGKYLPETQVNTAPGYIQIGQKTLMDPRNYGVLDLTKIIAKSSQVGISKIALDLPAQDVREVFFRAGLGQSLGLGFPGENMGLLPSRQRWHDIERATFAYGYGLNINGLQLAQVYSVIANEGVNVPTSFLKLENLPEVEQVFDPELTRQVAAMLSEVTSNQGSGRRAQIKSHSVAGKTGTVHLVKESGGYAENRYISLFTGFAPASNPRVVAAVVIHEPTRGGYFGGEIAAPVFSSVVEGALRLLHIVPDKIDHAVPNFAGGRE